MLTTENSRNDKTSFFERVYDVVKKIPRGKVMTYGQIAQILASKDARKVGWALHANKRDDVPCHRVVNKGGKVAENYAFGGGWREQKRRLETEGVVFVNEKTVDLPKHVLA